MTSLNLIRPDLIATKRYQACGDAMKHRLHLNELPWSPLSSSLNRYPCEKQEQSLQAILAALYRIKSSQLLITRGSDEGIDALMRLFLRPGIDRVMQFSPTFSMYAFFARLQLAQVIDCPLNHEDNFSFPLNNVEKTWRKNCKLIMICRPNNPTGNSLDLSTIASLCEQFRDRSIIVVDEAYIEFSSDLSAASLIAKYDNLVVLRTLSKAYGLAGLRLGSIIANPALIESVQNTLAPYRLSNQVIDTATQSLANPRWFKTALEQILAARSMLVQALERYPWITLYPSDANFLLIKTIHADKLFHLFSEQGIAVRRFNGTQQLHHHLRITVGDEAQNALLLNCLKLFQV